MGRKKEKNDDKSVKDRRKLGKSASGKKYHLSLMPSVGTLLKIVGTLHYNWPMSAHASQAFSMSSVPIV